MAKATNFQSSGFITPLNRSSSSPVRNRVRFASGKNLRLDTGFLSELVVFDGQHEHMTEEGKMSVDRGIRPQSLRFLLVHLHLGAHFGLNPTEIVYRNLGEHAIPNEQ